MKPKIHTLATWLLALSSLATAQTTTLTINNTSGQIIVPTGPTPYFDVLNVAGTPVPLLATPQRYGAIADGTSHPVSEWITSGKYANLAAIQADYPHVVTLDDEIDWAAAQQALRLNKSIFLPSVNGAYLMGNTTISHTLITQDDGQIIYGGGRQGPYGSSNGVLIRGGYGADAVRCQTAATRVQDLTIAGRTVQIHSLTGSPATLTTSANHGLRTAPVFTNGWTITGNQTGSRAIITTSAPHYLTTGDWVQVTGSSEPALNGIWQVNVCDASGTRILSPSNTATHFTLVRDQWEPSAPTNGGACSFTQLYEVIIGSYYGSGNTVTGAVPNDGSGEVLGRYLLRPTNSTAAEVYKYDRTALGLTTNANNDTGVIFLTHRGLCEGDDQSIDNYNQSEDHGKIFSASNLFIKDCVVGFYGSNSDGGGIGSHLGVSTCGTGIWADGNLDTMTFEACWVDSSMVAGYRVSRNGGMLVQGGGAVNCARPIYLGPNDTTSFDGGSSFFGYGLYFESHQRDVFADGSQNYYVDGGAYNRVVMEGARFQDAGESPIHFHLVFGGVMEIRNSGSFVQQLRAYSRANRGCVYGDIDSNVLVNLFGSTATSFDVTQYTAGDYLAYTADNPINLTQLISGISQSGSSSTIQVEDATQFTTSNYVSIRNTTSNDAINLPVTSIPDSTHIVVTHAGGSNASAGGIVERQDGGIDGATFSNIGLKTLVLPYGSNVTAHGIWEVLNIAGKPKWVHTGFDSLEVSRGGTGVSNFTAGDLLYATGSTTLTKLAKGSDGQVLTIDATTHLPVWAAATGAQTVWSAQITSPYNLTGSTTLANVSGLTVSAVPAGTYTVMIDGAVAYGPGGAGWKWDLNGGTAVIASSSNVYNRTTSWHIPGFQCVYTSDDGVVYNTALLADGESWSSSVPGAGRSPFHYDGTITITTSGSIVFRTANTLSSGDTGQLLGTRIVLIKQ